MPRQAAMIGRSTDLRRGLLVALCGLCLLGAAPLGHARRPAGPPRVQPQAQAGRLVQQGVMALAMRDFVAAYRALAAAYRLQPSADTLYQLGITALSSGDRVAAQDLMRRYLAEVGATGDPARRAEAQRITEQPRESSGEVSVLGPAGAFVLVDERLVGRLPLARPLLVAVGVHVLVVDQAGTPAAGRLEVASGQGLEARLSEDGRSLQLRRLPTVLVTGEPALAPPLQAVVTGALAAAGLASFDAAAHSGSLPPAECAPDRACLLRWAAAQGVQYTLELAVTAAPCAIKARLYEVALAEEASQRAAPCPAEGPGALERTLGELLPPLLTEGMARPQGTLRVTSQPPGAQVQLGARTLGRTPLVRPSFAQALELVVQLPGYLPEQRRVEVAATGTTEVQIELTAVPSPAAARPRVWQRQRPRWRLALGAIALGVGAGLIGFGASALAIDGGCVSSPVAPSLACERRYATSAAGVGLVVPGALLLGAGVAALAIPGPLRQVEAPPPRSSPAAAAADEK